MAQRKKPLVLLLLVLTGIFLFSGYVLVDYWLQSWEQKQVHGELTQLVRLPEMAQELPSHVSVTEPETGAQRFILREYEALYRRNSDLVGWICVEGTAIDYPVVQSAIKDYYLRRDFDKKRANHGSVYVWEEADVSLPSDNVTLFAHRMNDGTMFYDLLMYRERAFWQEHPIFRFSTLSEHYKYEIFAVFRTSGNGGEGFAYHTFVDAVDRNSFEAFVDQCRALSFYDTGITPRYGDKLVTLSTCDYALENGRMVVVGRRVE